MGIRQAIKGLFTGSPQSEGATEDAVLRLTQQVMRLGRELEVLQNVVEDRYAQFHAFRGRVYAWKRFAPPEASEEAPAKPDELPLNDPRLTKDQLRQRLGIVPSRKNPKE